MEEILVMHDKFKNCCVETKNLVMFKTRVATHCECHEHRHAHDSLGHARHLHELFNVDTKNLAFQIATYVVVQRKPRALSCSFVVYEDDSRHGRHLEELLLQEPTKVMFIVRVATRELCVEITKNHDHCQVHMPRKTLFVRLHEMLLARNALIHSNQ